MWRALCTVSQPGRTRAQPHSQLRAQAKLSYIPQVISKCDEGPGALVRWDREELGYSAEITTGYNPQTKVMKVFKERNFLLKRIRCCVIDFLRSITNLFHNLPTRIHLRKLIKVAMFSLGGSEEDRSGKPDALGQQACFLAITAPFTRRPSRCRGRGPPSCEPVGGG